MVWNHKADNAGGIPEVGDYVAYNYSGQIATGWIISIGKTKIIRIQQHFPTEGHISRINGGPKCVLVLEKSYAEKEFRYLSKRGKEDD